MKKLDSSLQLISILRDFHKITNARISIHDVDFNEIAAYPDDLTMFCSFIQGNKSVAKRCKDADRIAFEKVLSTGTTYTYTCHCGLIETVAPIYHYGVLSGFFMMGQITDNDDASIDKIRTLSSSFTDDKTTLEKVITSIPRIPTENQSSYVNILSIIAQYLTQSKKVAPKYDDLAIRLRHYIHMNYSGDLSVENLCSIFACSRTTLMSKFKSKFKTTVGEYISKYRLSKAEELIKESDETIKSIAISCGFSDQNYFTKVFLKAYKMTPIAYRKAITKEKL